MDTARWLVAFVAVVTAVGGLTADYLTPWSARQHMANPAWPPHAKFHNGQSIFLGMGLGILALALLFGGGALDGGRVMLAAVVASLYWDALLLAWTFPGTAWTDPEFEAITPRPLGLHPQQLIGFILLTILVAAVALALLSERP